MEHNSSLTFQPAQNTTPPTGPGPSSPMGDPGKYAPGKKSPPQKPKTPADALRQKQKERLQQQLMQTQKKLKMMHMAGRIAGKFVQAIPAQEDPNKDPMYLYGQVRPLLSKLRIQNLCVNNKTQLVVGKTQGNDSLYCVYLRRQAQITPDIINRFKMNLKNFEYMMWNSEAIEIYLWWTYVSPVQQQTPTTTGPAAPGPAKG